MTTATLSVATGTFSLAIADRIGIGSVLFTPGESGVGHFVFNGYPAVLTKPTYRLATAQGVYALGGVAGGLVKGLGPGLSAAAGSYVLALADQVTIDSLGAYVLSGPPGVYTLSGAPGVSDIALGAAVGAFVLTGRGIAFRHGLQFARSNLALTGASAGLRGARRLITAAGAFALSGRPAGLSNSAGPATLSATFGTYALTGVSVLVTRAGQTNLIMPAAVGVLALAGGAKTAPTKAARLQAAPGTFEIVGIDANVWVDHARASFGFAASAPTVLPNPGTAVLYPHASPLEKSMADADAERLVALKAELIVENWDPYLVETPNLPFLAYGMGVTLWEDDYWTEGVKREWVANQWTFKSLRGTIAGIRMALGVSDYALTQYVAPPQGFYASADLDPVVFNGWLRLMPELRVFYAHREGTRGLDEFFCENGFSDQDHVSIDDGFALRGRYAVLRQNGVDTPLQTYQVERGLDEAPGVELLRASLPGQSTLGLVLDEDFSDDNRFCCFEEQTPALVNVRIDRAFSVDATKVVMSSISPSQTPITPSFETNSDIGNGNGMSFVGDFADDRFADNPDGGGFLLADRIYLLDPVVAAPMTEGMSFADADRVGMPVQTVELMIELGLAERTPTMFVNESFAEEDYTVPEDSSHIDRAIRAVVAAKALRDTALISFAPRRPVELGDYVHADTKVGDWVPALL